MGRMEFGPVSVDRASFFAEIHRQRLDKPPLTRLEQEEYDRLLLYLGAAIDIDTPRLFSDYVSWLRETTAPQALSSDDVRQALGVLSAGFGIEGDRKAASLFVQRIQDSASVVSRLAPMICPGNAFSSVARAFLDSLLAFDTASAEIIVRDALDDGVSIQDLYVHVFQPCLHEVGRLWQTNQINVATEHYISAATQTIIARLYPLVFKGERKPLHLVASCVSGDLHEIGIRMVADLFELDGWRTAYLGASTPTDSLVSMVERTGPNVVALSATLSCHITDVAAMIVALKETMGSKAPKVLVGGYPFSIEPTLWQRVGADGTARNGVEAVAVANQLVQEAQ